MNHPWPITPKCSNIKLSEEGKTMSVKIVTDTSSDVPQDVATNLDITLVPLILRFGHEEFLDRQLTSEEFWERARRGPMPQTSQPSIGAFESAFAPLVNAGHEVVCVTITSKHSGTYNAAWAAAQQFGNRVAVFDSLSLSWGLGFQVLAAAKAAQAGATTAEILALLTDMRERVRVILVLDTMENLKRGGRADKLIPVFDRLAKVFNIKPLINLVDGELKLYASARSYTKALERLTQDTIAYAPVEHLAVMHTCRPELANSLADRLAREMAFPRDQIPVGEIATVLACHGGEGVLGAVSVLKKEGSGVSIRV